MNDLKKIYLLVFVVFMLLLSACSQNQDSVEPPDISEYQFANEDYEEVDILQPSQKTVYIYFTGVNWNICLSQLVKLNQYLTQFEENEISVYAVSQSSPAEHVKLKKLHDLDFAFITDVQLIFPSQFGFYDDQSQSVLRGYIGVNPETDKVEQGIDFLFGDKAEEILEKMKNL